MAKGVTVAVESIFPLWMIVFQLHRVGAFLRNGFLIGKCFDFYQESPLYPGVAHALRWLLTTRQYKRGIAK